ncbi:hypothetical protein H1C71_028978, partial [Ictidomys tridecemlineatus]
AAAGCQPGQVGRLLQTPGSPGPSCHLPCFSHIGGREAEVRSVCPAAETRAGGVGRPRSAPPGAQLRTGSWGRTLSIRRGPAWGRRRLTGRRESPPTDNQSQDRMALHPSIANLSQDA